MTMFVQIARRVPRMIMVLAGLFVLPSFVPVAVLVQVARLVSWMIMVLAGLFLGHIGSPQMLKS